VRPFGCGHGCRSLEYEAACSPMDFGKHAAKYGSPPSSCPGHRVLGGRIAELSGVRVLCPACDHARHFARAGQLGLAADALQILAQVDNISDQAARERQEQARSAWRRRSRLSWDVTVSPALLDRHAALVILAGQHGSPGEGRDKVNLAASKLRP
jgi:hypothetical protein